jgi:hypothetical protein
MPRALAAPNLAASMLMLAALLLASPAAAERDLGAQAGCLAKQLRKHGGPEGGRASAMKAHFECFPADPERFVALFDTNANAVGPLAADHSAHLELFFAARPAVGERTWAVKAVGVLAGGEWRAGAIDLYADLLLMQIKSRAPAPLDAAAKLDDAMLAAFWRALFGGAEGFKPDATLCAGRETQRACAMLAVPSN